MRDWFKSARKPRWCHTNRGFPSYRRAGQKDLRRKRPVLNYEFKLNFSRNLFVKYLDMFMRKEQCILKIANLICKLFWVNWSLYILWDYSFVVKWLFLYICFSLKNLKNFYKCMCFSSNLLILLRKGEAKTYELS